MNETKEVTVDVTREDILMSRCGDPHRCGIATAVRRLIKPRVWVSVTDDGITLGRDHSVDIPTEAHDFISEFDNCREHPDSHATRKNKENCKPVSFKVRIPVRFLLTDEEKAKAVEHIDETEECQLHQEVRSL